MAGSRSGVIPGVFASATNLEVRPNNRFQVMQNFEHCFPSLLELWAIKLLEGHPNGNGSNDLEFFMKELSARVGWQSGCFIC